MILMEMPRWYAEHRGRFRITSDKATRNDAMYELNAFLKKVQVHPRLISNDGLVAELEARDLRHVRTYTHQIPSIDVYIAQRERRTA